MATIPHGNVVADTGEQPTLSDAKEDTAGKKTTEIVNQTHASPVDRLVWFSEPLFELHSGV